MASFHCCFLSFFLLLFTERFLILLELAMGEGRVYCFLDITCHLKHKMLNPVTCCFQVRRQFYTSRLGPHEAFSCREIFHPRLTSRWRPGICYQWKVCPLSVCSLPEWAFLIDLFSRMPLSTPGLQVPLT